MSTTYVYDKATDAGGDRFIVVPPNNLFQLPFSNEDWNSIKVGIIHSATNSASGGAEEMWLPQPSGDTWPDEFAGPENYSFIGIGISAASPLKPATPGNGFIGLSFDGIQKPGDTSGDTFTDDTNKYSVQYLTPIGSLENKWRFVVDNGVSSTAIEKEASFDWSGIPIALPNLSASSNFASYLGLKYTVINKNQSNQQMEIEVRLYSTNGGHEIVNGWKIGMQTDTSINNLKERVILDAYPRELSQTDIHRATFDWHVNGTPLPLPNAFIWYNSFFSVRPRLHSIAIKRES